MHRAHQVPKSEAGYADFDAPEQTLYHNRGNVKDIEPTIITTTKPTKHEGIIIHYIYELRTQVGSIFYLVYTLHINVIYRFSSISRSTRAIFKFQKLRSLLEIAQNILIVHLFDK